MGGIGEPRWTRWAALKCLVLPALPARHNRCGPSPRGAAPPPLLTASWPPSPPSTRRAPPAARGEWGAAEQGCAAATWPLLPLLLPLLLLPGRGHTRLGHTGSSQMAWVNLHTASHSHSSRGGCLPTCLPPSHLSTCLHAEVSSPGLSWMRQAACWAGPWPSEVAAFSLLPGPKPNT